MPSTVKVRVKAARNLPLPDNNRGAAFGLGRDPYVIVTLGGHPKTLSDDDFVRTGFMAKTKVCKRTIHPVWDEDFRFEVSDDTILQDEPLIFKVCDFEVSFGKDESIGLVYLDLNPLLRAEDEAYGIDGWFPLYDTLSGVRGQLLVSVKLNFIGDVNPFRDSSAGVRLLPFSTIDPHSEFTVKHIFGFVEELVVADDPYEWNQQQTSRTQQHETRQTLLYLLDASVRRRMSKTVLERGGNAVLGYHQNFDVEGDSGIVARTYGTCVLLERKQKPLDNHDKEVLDSSETVRGTRFLSMELPIYHKDDDIQLLTMSYFDSSVRVRFGGLVTARSVKYLGNLASKLSDQETRDSWWAELREEIRAHAKVLCCTHVIGYLEASTIHGECLHSNRQLFLSLLL
jgi:hypothetical protein